MPALRQHGADEQTLEPLELGLPSRALAVLRVLRGSVKVEDAVACVRQVDEGHRSRKCRRRAAGGSEGGAGALIIFGNFR